MKVINLKETCGGCPTVFEWENRKGHMCYFRLRHGYAKIVNQTKDKIIIEDTMRGFDGVCSWDEVVEWASEYGLKLKQI